MWQHKSMLKGWVRLGVSTPARGAACSLEGANLYGVVFCIFVEHFVAGQERHEHRLYVIGVDVFAQLDGIFEVATGCRRHCGILNLGGCDLPALLPGERQGFRLQVKALACHYNLYGIVVDGALGHVCHVKAIGRGCLGLQGG